MTTRTSIASKMSQMRYGEGVYNIEFDGIEVRDFLSHAYPEGIEKELRLEALEKYGLAVNFARRLQEYKKFVLSAPQSGVANIFCGQIPGLPAARAKIVIDNSTFDFLAGGFESFLSLKEGNPIAVARVEESGEQNNVLVLVYFFGKVRPVA